MVYPTTDPNELAVIAVADFFAGRNWSGVMVSVDYYYGFLQGLIYTPIVFFFDDPGFQYSAILFVNSALISIVPLIAYYLAYRFRTGKIWKCIVTSFVAGGYCCYFAHTKFAWTETISILLPWVMIWLVFRISDCKGKMLRFIMSCVTGIVCGLSFAAHTRLTAVVLALVIALVLERVFFGKKMINFVGFGISLGASTILTAYVSYILQRYLWCCENSSLLNNTLTGFFAKLPDMLANDGYVRFAETLSAQFYYYAATTWGLGAVSFCLFAAILSACIKHKHRKEPQTYELEISLFAFFSVFTVIFTILFETFYRFGNENYFVYQDTMMFGRFLDGVVPFALVFVLIMLFTHSIGTNKILGAAAVLGIIYTTFFLAAVPAILGCKQCRMAPVLGLYPLRVGASGRELFSFDSFLLTMSMTFCVMGVLIVVISCTKKYRSIIISTLMTIITVYSMIFISVVYLPVCAQEAKTKNESVESISESVFDQSGAPAITAYNISRHDALMLQFLNRNVTVKWTYDIESVPENSFLVVNKNEDVSALENSRTPFLLVAESSGLKLYAYGERAAAYMVSQDIADEEREAEKDTLIPEKTAAPVDTVTSGTTTPSVSTTTTERTPVVTTYPATSAMTTVNESSLGDEDEWFIIE